MKRESVEERAGSVFQCTDDDDDDCGCGGGDGGDGAWQWEVGSLSDNGSPTVAEVPVHNTMQGRKTERKGKIGRDERMEGGGLRYFRSSTPPTAS